MKTRILISAMITLFASLSLLIHFVLFPYYTERSRNELFQKLTDKIVKEMSLEQKVGQLLHVGMPGKRINKTIRREIEKHYSGGVILFAKNMGSKREIQTLTESLQKVSLKASGIPLFISTDQEGGRVYRVGADATVQFPGAMALGQTGRPGLARDVGFITGYELNQIGINLILAPVLDVNNNPGNPVIHTRSFGSNTLLVSKMGIALADGIRKAHSIPVIKHFPGHGDTKIDSHLALPRINKKIHEMNGMELAPFRDAIKGGAEVVMSAHILYESLDDKYPATLSRKILTGLLREQLGFNGLIITDAMEMHAITRRYSRKEAVKLAFKAGADIILLTSLGRISNEMYNSLLKGFKTGELSVEKLDASIKRQIALKLKRGFYYRSRADYYNSGRSDEYFKELDGYFRELFLSKKARYNEINRRYLSRGVTLNSEVADLSISALRRKFPGLATYKKEKIRLFYKSRHIRAAALTLGIKPGQIRRLNPGSLVRRLRKRRIDEIWIVELRRRDVKSWNRLVQKNNRIEKKRIRNNRLVRKKAGAQTIALYPGNPFLPFRIPDNGAILASFSPTKSSLRALINRALDGRPVRKADLVLPELVR